MNSNCTTEHTPGPWKPNKDYFRRIEDSNGNMIAGLIDAPVNENILPITEANARLIAAAPEMLERLERTYSILTNLYDRLVRIGDDEPLERVSKELELISDTIKKAKGE